MVAFNLPNLTLPWDRLGEDVNSNKIHVGQRYAVRSVGGCVSCIAKAKGIPPSEDPGQEFFSLPFFGLGGNGGHAEYAVVDEEFLVPVVSKSSYMRSACYGTLIIYTSSSRRTSSPNMRLSWLMQASSILSLIRVSPSSSSNLCL